jgi:hypothetical protein
MRPAGHANVAPHGVGSQSPLVALHISPSMHEALVQRAWQTVPGPAMQGPGGDGTQT